MVMVMASMASVAAMHKEMHQWAGQQEQERENAQHMGAMFGKEQCPADHKKAEHHEPRPGSQKAALPGVRMLVVHFVRHKARSLVWMS